MKRVVGFALFGIAIGLVIAMLLPNTFVTVLCVMLCLLAGYNLFSVNNKKGKYKSRLKNVEKILKIILAFVRIIC